MNENDLNGSQNEWEQLLRMNSNNYLAYKGLGRIADYRGDYRQAMDYFKLAYAQEGICSLISAAPTEIA